MSQKNSEANGRPDDGRLAEHVVRAALCADDLMIPLTADQVKRFEEELARTPVDVPAHLLTSEWLFSSIADSAELAPSPNTVPPARENWALAAREGSAIPAEIADRMKNDRARNIVQRAGQMAGSEEGEDTAIQFACAPRLREIAELAEWIAQECYPTGPVDPVAIASRNDIGLSFNDYEEAFDGLLEHREGRFHIYCNLRRVENQNADRARFTLAHELGHFYIDAHRRMLERGKSLPLSQCDYESAQPIEQEADGFAAHLLMPSQPFVKHARGMKSGLPTILALRRHFRTSVTSTACRYATIGLSPCVVVKWSKAGYGWNFISSQARGAGFRDVVRSKTSLPEESPTAKALSGALPPAKGYFEAGTTAAIWFRSVTHGSFQNAILVEQAIPLGRFGALTILYPESGQFPENA
jgi:hypothetical protein